MTTQTTDSPTTTGTPADAGSWKADPEATGTVRQTLSEFVTEKARVLVVLALICVIFGIANPLFLSPVNISNLVLQTASIGVISTGIVLVLLLGEIDLSAGAVSGLGAGLMGVCNVYLGLNPFLAILLALVAAAAIGFVQGMFSTLLKVPSFIITLAGLLTWQGVLLLLLGGRGTVNIDDDSIIAIASTFLPASLGWLIGLGAVGIYLLALLARRRRETALGVRPASLQSAFLRTAGIAIVVLGGVALLNEDRGVPLSFLILLAVILVAHLILTGTTAGKYVYAVGGNDVAAARVGINVTRVRVVAFTLCSVLAAVGGILAASRLQAVTQAAGGSDLLLLAIAGPVIAGVSLFGGRGSVWGALLGALIIGAISNGMDLLSIDAAVKLVVTGAVLAAAVALDALTTMRRRKRGRI